MKQPLWERVATHSILIVASAIAVFPILWVFSTSFKNQFDVLSTEIELIPADPTLENYQALFDPGSATGGFFWNWFGNSLLISVLTTALSVFLAATAGYALSRHRFWGKRPSTTFFLVSQMFPAVILMVPLYQLLGIQFRLLNTPWALVLAYATTAVPFCVLMLKSYFDTLPIELEEAGKIDGLGPFGAFWRIVVPLSTPGIAVTAFYAFITAWNEFLFALVFLTEPESFTLPIGVRLFINQFTQNWGGTMALSVIVTIPVMVFFYLAQRYLISGLATGGVKG
ncbi:MAG TPA: carbohydrate ABC transporter permease [Candidatus Limnocylindria bacterium]|nr:carbohydrate ABC transporter permease [Candidatus Limnocylindria bacterium]